MNRKVLHDLLERYTTNQCSEEERLLVEHWYELIGERRDVSLAEKDWDSLENQIWEKLHPGKRGGADGIVKPLWRRFSTAMAGIAAAAIVIFGYYWFQMSAIPERDEARLVAAVEQGQWTLYENETTQPRKIRLADGSIIGLAAHSQLAVSRAFNVSNRNVRLLGQASFDVARNPAVPFMLFCGDMVTKVIGTRFQVVAKSADQPMEVSVSSGKVTVYRSRPEKTATASGSNGVILTPNQKATYYPDNKQFVASLTDHPELVAPSAETATPISFVFEETPLREIIERLQIAYGIEIELEQEAIANCPFTGNLSQKDLYTKLELLCGSVNGSYEVRGTKILVMGKGCQ